MRQFHPDLLTTTVFQNRTENSFVSDCIVSPTNLQNELICTWTTGGWHEMLEGNMTLFSRSRDNGNNWSEPSILFCHPFKGVHTTTLDLHQGVLTAYFTAFHDMTAMASDAQSFICESYDGGYTFVTPHSFPGYFDPLSVNQVTHIGDKLYLSVQWYEIADGAEWAAPTIGHPPKDCIVSDRKSIHAEVPVTCSDMDMITARDKWVEENTRSYIGVLISEDNGKSFRLHGRITGLPEPRHLSKPMIVRLSDSRLVMFMYSKKEKLSYQSVSCDEGLTWSPPVKLNTPPTCTNIFFCTNSQDTIYSLHNTDESGHISLVLKISNDGLSNWPDKRILIDGDETITLSSCYYDKERQAICISWNDGTNIFFSIYPISN